MKRIIAVTGPSGAGKTTLGNLLKDREGYAVPRHCTTRSKRSDDAPDFYRFLSHEEYNAKLQNGEFILSSGDGPEVKKEYGNFYGVLRSDCEEAWKDSDTIILFVSYKDIYRLQEIKNENISVSIVNLTFKDINKGVIDRITNDPNRNHSPQDVINRAKNASELHAKYSKALQRFADVTIYTDLYGIEEVYNQVTQKINNEIGD